ncbi:MAG: D-2-hydroxyacid dehydrogenase [Arenicellales bacterium]|nr:D-2-hydroxyacid dehydrogenase [Arenicellales bacterium]
MNNKRTVVVLGAKNFFDLPGTEQIKNDVNWSFATTVDDLRRVLPSSEILLGWDFRAEQLQGAWDYARELKWIHWCGAGVDAALFKELRQSNVTLTNARGVFDRAMAEYVLGLVIALTKFFPQTFAAMANREWVYRRTEMIENRQVLIVGVGSIGRRIARLLKSVGMRVSGVGRSERPVDEDFDYIHATENLTRVLGNFDFVVNVVPLTETTKNLFSQPQFSAMQSSARFINIGRGASVDETALFNALQNGEITAAALDVFVTEPLPSDSPLWSVDNLIISPHISGDYIGFEKALIDLFADNLRRYLAGAPLRNVVDKEAGFVTD